MKYNVTVRVSGFVSVGVEASSMDVAKQIANDEVCDMDFGPLRTLTGRRSRQNNFSGFD